MKLLSLNMHCGLEDYYDEKLRRIANFVVNENVTVLTLQEVGQPVSNQLIKEHYGITIKQENMVKRLVELINLKSNYKYDYYYDVSHIGFDTIDEGLAIVSLYPILAVESRYVTESMDKHDWKSRKIVRAKLSIDGQPINVFSCHFGWWEDDTAPAKNQFNLFNQWVSDQNMPSIIAGDFNNPAGSVGYEYLVDTLGYKDLVYESNPDLFYVPTIYEGERQEPIDFVFTNNHSVKSISARHVFTDEDTVSDHVGIMIEIKIK